MNLIIDFDNTFITKETIDVLASYSSSEQEQKVARLTEQAMSGDLDFAQALEQRLSIVTLNKRMVALAVDELRQCISPSFYAHKSIIKSYADHIYIVSGGFKQIIVPIVEDFGIPAQRVLANAFIYDQEGKVTGINQQCPLAQNAGKVLAISSLNLKGNLVMVGDGMTDLEVYTSGCASHFYAYTENCSRDKVISQAPRVANNIGIVLKDIGWTK